jgi:hypothetical protein
MEAEEWADRPDFVPAHPGSKPYRVRSPSRGTVWSHFTHATIVHHVAWLSVRCDVGAPDELARQMECAVLGRDGPVNLEPRSSPFSRSLSRGHASE